MSKKRNKKRKRKKSKTKRNFQLHREDITPEYDHIEFYKYSITNEPVNLIKIPQEIENEVEELFYKSQEKPEEAIGRLETLTKEYPSLPQLYNYLSIAYSRVGNIEKAEKITEINYKKNPGYLFAKLNYAEICIRKGELEKIPGIFDNKFEIKALYPERNVFHVTEVVGFWGVTGMYFALCGYTDKAKVCYKNLKEFVPDHPFTKKLGIHLEAIKFDLGT